MRSECQGAGGTFLIYLYLKGIFRSSQLAGVTENQGIRVIFHFYDGRAVRRCVKCRLFVAFFQLGPEGRAHPRTRPIAPALFHHLLELLRHIPVPRHFVSTRFSDTIQVQPDVNWRVCKYLHEAGAKLFVSDIQNDAVARAEADFGAESTAGMDIYSQDVDVFAPCALGAELNGRTIPRLKAQIVAGAANNQLERPEDGADLAARGILYAPDYVINAGGVINLSYERESGYDRARAMTHTARIHDVAIEIFGRAERESRPTSDIADDMAKELPAATG